MYTEQEKLFAEIYVEECRSLGDSKAAGAIALNKAGYPQSTRLNTVLKRVKDLLVEVAVVELVKDIPKVLKSMGEVLDDPTVPGAKTTIALATTWLDRAGLIKKEESTVTVKAPDGILILPPKNKEL